MKERIALFVFIMCAILGIAAGAIIGHFLIRNSDFVTVTDYLVCYGGMPFTGCIFGLLLGAWLSDLIDPPIWERKNKKL